MDYPVGEEGLNQSQESDKKSCAGAQRGPARFHFGGEEDPHPVRKDRFSTAPVQALRRPSTGFMALSKFI